MEGKPYNLGPEQQSTLTRFENEILEAPDTNGTEKPPPSCLVNYKTGSFSTSLEPSISGDPSGGSQQKGTAFGARAELRDPEEDSTLCFGRDCRDRPPRSQCGVRPKGLPPYPLLVLIKHK